jgi:hypothetical protein
MSRMISRRSAWDNLGISAMISALLMAEIHHHPLALPTIFCSRRHEAACLATCLHECAAPGGWRRILIGYCQRIACCSTAGLVERLSAVQTGSLAPSRFSKTLSEIFGRRCEWPWHPCRRSKVFMDVLSSMFSRRVPGPAGLPPPVVHQEPGSSVAPATRRLTAMETLGEGGTLQKSLATFAARSRATAAWRIHRSPPLRSFASFCSRTAALGVLKVCTEERTWLQRGFVSISKTFL